MKSPLTLALLSAAALSASHTISSPTADIQPGDPCEVRAWVRAEDLSPEHVSHGELRIKVPRAQCTQQIASVALRLQLDEFSEVKFLKEGAVLPELQPAANQSELAGFSHSRIDWEGPGSGRVVYDYQAYHDAMSDPALWTVRAEERRAWATEATLLDGDLDFSQPIVTPFTVAVPPVNYPPALFRWRHLDSPVSRHSFSDLGYRYIAIVNFIDGRTVDVPAGRTTFVPTIHARPAQTPFAWNTTFVEWSPSHCWDDAPEVKKRADELERCLPEAQRSAFVAEVTLEGGNVVTKGSPIKGRVTVHNTNGSTSMSHISVHLRTVQRDHWAQAQAADGGDIDFPKPTMAMCPYSTADAALDPESENYGYLFDDEFFSKPRQRDITDSSLSNASPSFEFEVRIPQDTLVDFASYYAHSENMLQLDLTVLFSQEAAICVDPSTDTDARLPTDDAIMTEERLWDSYTPIGQKVVAETYRRELGLQAVVPITVVSSAPASARPIAHYLTPGLLAPVLRRSALTDTLTFSAAQPVVSLEPLVDTSARLMQASSSDLMPQASSRMVYNHEYPDPSKDYDRGDYAGLLWRKKVVSEERETSPIGFEEAGEKENGQKYFTT